MPIKYVVGDATEPQLVPEKYNVIAHVCNDQGGFGKGFAAQLAKKYPEAKAFYRKKAIKGELKLGHDHLVVIKDDLGIVNMICQKGYWSIYNPTPLSYEHLIMCLENFTLITDPKLLAVHMPMIGIGLAGGNWEIVEYYIKEHLIRKTGVEDVIVYKLPESKEE